MHAAYRWICGGVSLNHHTLSDFRVGHGKFLDQLLTRSVAALMHTGVVQLERVAHDGMRVRAGAGKKSFRGRLSMERCLGQAQQRVQRLQAELQADPAVDRDRLRAARERAAQESAARVAQALAELAKLEARKQAAQTGRKKEPRVSLTDPEARTMKMADSGFRPAYNVQFATDTATRVVVGVDVTNIGSDQGQMRPMFEQLHQRYARGPREYLADGDFTNLHDIDHLERAGVRVYAPPRRPRNPDRPVHAPVDRDTPATRIWRKRMAGEEAQRIYRQRASTAEFVNAQARNHGLRQFVVRGLAKVRTIALWHALAHNLQRMFSLTKSCQLAT
jgi:hypothetical protein